MLRVTAEFTGIAGTPYYSHDYYGGDTSGEANAALGATYDFWFQLEHRLISGLVMRTDPEVHLIDPATGLTTDTFAFSSAIVSFDNAGQPLPFATQGLLKYSTGDYINGRQLRGRKFIPGVPEDACVSGAPEATFMAAVETAFIASRPEATGAGGQVVYSPTHKQWSLITGASVWNKFAVLRSRRD